MAEREILFRGKRNDNGEWVEGSFCGLDLDSGSYSYIIENSRRMNKSTVFDDFQHNSVLVIPETVGQYTGLTDENGKRIFEGDIVERVSDGEQAVISWLKYFACFGLSFDGWCCGFDDYDFSLNDFKVIGNIHDNPEILKGGGDNG